MRFCILVLCLLVLCAQSSLAAIIFANATTYSYPGFTDTTNAKAIALSGLGSVRLHRLSANSTYGTLQYFSRSALTGALTAVTEVTSTILSYSRPYLVGCTDVKATTVAVYVACSSVVVNASLTEPSRILILNPTTLAILQTQYAHGSAFGTSGGSLALFGSSVTSIALGTSVVGCVNFASINLVSGVLNSASAVSGTPISEGVYGIDGALLWYGNTNPTTPGFKIFARSSASGVVTSSGSSGFGSGASIAAVYAMVINTGTNNIYSMELPTGQFRPKFRTYSLSFNVGGGTPPPPVVPTGSPVYSNFPDTAVRSMLIPTDDRHIYVTSNTSLYEYRRSVSANNGGVPVEITTVTSGLTNPRGIAISSDGLFMYMNNGSGVLMMPRDSVTINPSLINPVTSTKYKNIPVKYNLPEAPSNTVRVSIVGASTYVFTMLQIRDVDTTIVSSNPGSSVSVASFTGNPTVADGAYSVTLSYQDVYNNEPATSSTISVTVDNTNPVITVTTPANSAVIRSTAIALSYSLSEACGSGTITFYPRSGLGNTVVWTIGSSGLTSGAKSGTIDSASVSGIIASSTGGTLDGAYDVVFAVTDQVGNVGTPVTRTPVTFRVATQAPVWISPALNAVLTSGSNTYSVSIATPATAGSLQFTFTPRTGSPTTLVAANVGSTNGTKTVTFDISNPTGSSDIASGSAFAAGEYNITASVQDDAGNTAATSVLRNVVIGSSLLNVSLVGVTSGNTYDVLFLNFTLPMPSLQGRATITFFNNNYTRTLVVGNNDITSTFFFIRRMNVSGNYAATPSQFSMVGGSLVSALPTSAFARAWLDQYYALSISFTDYAGRFTLSRTLAVNLMLTGTFCTYSFQAQCNNPGFLSCAVGCASNPGSCASVTTEVPVIVYIDRNQTVTVVTVVTETQNIIVYRDGVNVTYYNTTTRQVSIPIATSGWSDAQFWGMVAAASVLLLVVLILGAFEWQRHATVSSTNGYQKVNMSD